MYEFIRDLVPATAVAFLLLGFVGYLVVVTLATTGWSKRLESLVFRDASHNIGLPTCALTAFAVVVVLNSTLAPPADMAAQLFNLKLTGVATPVVLWLIVYAALVLSMRAARPSRTAQSEASAGLDTGGSLRWPHAATGKRALSPYLQDSSRLGDVVAAIQVMATYRFYKLSFSGWADRISADKLQAAKWKRVFTEHPEFFRLDSTGTKASLVWRRQFPKRYNVDTLETLSSEECANLPGARRLRISRIPLSPADIKTLVDTAVNMHSRALEHRKDQRWWTALAGAAGALIGTLIGPMVKLVTGTP